MATKAERDRAKQFVDQAFTDAIAWKAARVLLERALPVVEKAGDEELTNAIIRFLANHPR